MSIGLIILLAYVQNISFSMVSRARNRDSQWYHASCSVMSNGLWFATFHLLVVEEMGWELLVPYIIGTVAGSVTGSKVSMWIEERIGAKV